MEGRLLLDVVVAQSAAIFQLLPSEDESLLVWRDAFLVLDFGLDVLDGVACFDFQGDGLASECLHEDLHAATQTEHQMEGRLLLDVVVAQSAAIFQLLPSEDESLLVWRDAFLVLDFGLDVLDGVACFDFQGDGLASECLHEDLHAATQTEHQMEGRLLLDVVVAQSAAIFQLLPSEDESLLVWRDPFLILDLGLDVLDGVACFDFQGDGLASECLHEDLHAATQTEHQMEGRLLLDVVVAQSAAIFQLLPSEDESLLVWRDALFVLDFRLDVLDGVACFDFQGDGLASECLHEDLHAATQTEHQMEGRLLLDVVVAQSAAVLELFASEDESLLVWRDAFLVLDFGLDVLDGVTCLHLEGDGLASERLHEDLHGFGFLGEGEFRRAREFCGR